MNEREIFMEALDLGTSEQRSSFLNSACAGDQVLRRRIEALLVSHEEAGSFLGKVVPEHLIEQLPTQDTPSPNAHIDDTLEAPITNLLGTTIGPYKLLGQIGEGGMGTVFLAEQTEPVQRKVAIKIIKPGMDSKQVLARFEAERQALALMEHPNIAHVLDAGATESGRPYFVMELVKGVPITQYCDEHCLTVRERLELFLPVCQAVQHAHQKGIIHRDLKPSNILVALSDGKPAPKVIDFGVAKATGGKLTDQSLLTEFGAVIGTLEYMSPEQAELDQLDIDTRSDVYSLGIVLYELLTGNTPLAHQRIKDGRMLELLKSIREEDTPRPSVRISTTGELQAVAEHRGVEARKLKGMLRGELDWIVMKALEKDRNRRYESANAFARDVQRFLNDEPVQAFPPSLVYRARKFVRRNKAAVLAASLIVAALLLSTFFTSWGMMRALDAEHQAKTERDLKDKALQEKEKALKIAERRNEYARAAAYELVEVSHGWLHQRSLFPQEKRFLSKALALFKELATEKAETAEDIQYLADANGQIGVIHAQLGHYREAETAFGISLSHTKRLIAKFPEKVRYKIGMARQLCNLMVFVGTGDRWREAENIALEALQILDPIVKSPPGAQLTKSWKAAAHNTYGMVLNNLAEFQLLRGNSKEALINAKKAVAHQNVALGVRSDSLEYRVHLRNHYFNVARASKGVNDYPHAEQAYQQALGEALKLTAEKPADAIYRQFTAHIRVELADLANEQGKSEQAAQRYRNAAAALKQMTFYVPHEAKNFDLWRAVCLAKLGYCLVSIGDPGEVQAIWEESLYLTNLRKSEEANESLETRLRRAESFQQLGVFASRLGKSDEAIRLSKDSLEMFEGLTDETLSYEWLHKFAMAHANLAKSLSDESSGVASATAEQETHERKALAILRELNQKAPNRLTYQADLALVCSNLAATLFAKGKQDGEAEELYEEAIDLAENVLNVLPTYEYRVDLARAQNGLASVQRRLGKTKETENTINKALAASKQLVKERPKAVEARKQLAQCYNVLASMKFAASKPDEAAELVNEACKIYGELHKELPLRVDLLGHWASNLGNRGLALWKSKDLYAAQKSLEQSVDAYDKLAQARPKAAQWLYDAGGVQYNLAMLLEEIGKREEAQAQFGLAAERFAQAVTINPEREDYRQYLCSSFECRRGLIKKLNRSDLMKAFCLRAVELLQPLVEKYDLPDLEEELAVRYAQLGQHYLQNGPIIDGIDPYRKSEKHFRSLSDKKYRNSENRKQRILVLLNLGVVFDRAGRYSESESAYRKALETTESHSLAAETQSRFSFFLANCPNAKIRNPKEALDLALMAKQAQPKDPAHWNAIGVSYYRLGRWQDAVDALMESINHGGFEWYDPLFLAMACKKLGKQGEAKEWFERVDVWFEKNGEDLNRRLDAKILFERLRAEAADVLGIAQPKNEPKQSNR